MSEEKTKSDAFLIINENQVFHLIKGETIIGRSGKNDLILNDQRVSRKHAKISLINSKFLLTDLNSSGGTYVNGKPIVQKLIADGDILTFNYGQKIIFHNNPAKLPQNAKPYQPLVVEDSDINTASLDETDVEG